MLAVLVLAGGCASSGKAKPTAVETPAAPRTSANSATAMHKLDVVPRTIAPELLDALEYPYRKPVPSDCASLGAQIARLDVLLGPDLDDPALSAPNDHAIADLFVSGLRSAIPYFGWIRRLTGVDRREHRAALAAAAGDARRGYLKGLGEAQGCQPPAAPTPPPVAPASDDATEDGS